MARNLRDALTALRASIDANEQIMADVMRIAAQWTSSSPDDTARWEELLEWGTEQRIKLQALYAALDQVERAL